LRQWPVARWLASLCLGLAIAGVPPAAAEVDGDWPIPGRDLAGFRYSGLGQIDAGNVGRLAVAWTFSLGVLRGQEAAPIVADGTMFVVTAYPNILYALDLSRPGAPVWFASQQASYALVPWACEGGPLIAIHLVNAVALLLIGLAAALIWRDRRRAGPASGRAGFLSMVSLMACGLFGLAIIAQMTGVLFFGPCQR
jgi:hypothetical protein